MCMLPWDRDTAWDGAGGTKDPEETTHFPQMEFFQQSCPQVWPGAHTFPAYA